MVEWTDLVLMTPKSYEIFFVDLILLFIGLFYVFLNNTLKLTQYEVRWVGLVLRILTMYDTCMLVLCY